jgi:hypothetical protein
MLGKEVPKSSDHYHERRLSTGLLGRECTDSFAKYLLSKKGLNGTYITNTAGNTSRPPANDVATYTTC